MFKATSQLSNKTNKAEDIGQPVLLSAASPLTWWAAGLMATILGFSRLSYGLLLPALRTSLLGSYSLLGLIGTINFAGYLLVR
ncbi:YbfB/YjiJ family MFS transporter [Ktedonosporobacter rubrisoli]|uniref:YbfB/YjiJ family MFS transporter n=1 Tax=Ktedonosporobacter rubrisoli TaxID=2509675 RepID=A0A4P6JQE1_KTERU|nr:YbfB/YjiJ family MFS transporter [Ktedonosporobacter rubrisoli]QBD77638.1 YbfB/YjiJ family MFS transporter [Ktedonosporobacter rubrisoli]